MEKEGKKNNSCEEFAGIRFAPHWTKAINKEVCLGTCWTLDECNILGGESMI